MQEKDTGIGFFRCLRKHKTLLKILFWNNSDKMLVKVVVEKITEEIACIELIKNIQV